MLRKFSVAFAVIALGSVAASAADTAYRDSSGRFSVTVPDGWNVQDIGDTRVALMVSAPDADNYSGVCIFGVKEIPEMRQLTQAQIDEVFGKEINRQFWDAMYQATGAKDVAVEDTGMREQNGHHAYYSVASATLPLPTGGVMRAKNKIQLQVIPGSLHIMSCRSTADGYAAYALKFETMFASHIPLGSGYIASLSRSGPATLGLNSAKPDARRNVNTVRTIGSNLLDIAFAPRRR